MKNKNNFLAFIALLLVSSGVNAKCLLSDSTFNGTLFTNTAVCEETGVSYTKTSTLGSIEARFLAASDCSAVCNIGTNKPSLNHTAISTTLVENSKVNVVISLKKDLDNDYLENYFEIGKSLSRPKESAFYTDSTYQTKINSDFVKTDNAFLNTGVVLESDLGTKTIQFNAYAFDAMGNAFKKTTIISPVIPYNIRPTAKIYIKEEDKPERLITYSGGVSTIEVNDGQAVIFRSENTDADGTIQSILWTIPSSSLTDSSSLIAGSVSETQSLILPNIPANSVKKEEFILKFTLRDNEYVSDSTIKNSVEYYTTTVKLLPYNSPIKPILKINGNQINCQKIDNLNYTCDNFTIKERNNLNIDLTESKDNEGSVAYLTNISGGKNLENYSSIEGNNVFYVKDVELSNNELDTLNLNIELKDNEGQIVKLTSFIKVENENHLPQISFDNSISMNEEEIVSYPLFVSDFEEDKKSTPLLNISIEDLNPEKNMSYSIDPLNKKLQIQSPKVNKKDGIQSAKFKIIASDSEGGITEKTINVDVTPLNTLPVIIGEFYDVEQKNVFIADKKYQLLLNNSYDTDSLDPLSFIITSNDPLLTINKINNETFEFIPNNFTPEQKQKTITFTVKAIDSDGEFSVKTIDFTYKPSDNISFYSTNCSIDCSNLIINHNEKDGDITITHAIKDYSLSNNDNGLIDNYEQVDFSFEIIENNGKVFDLISLGTNSNEFTLTNVNESKENKKAKVLFKVKNKLTGKEATQLIEINFFTFNESPIIENIVHVNETGFTQDSYKAGEKIDLGFYFYDNDGQVKNFSISSNDSNIVLNKVSDYQYSFVSPNYKKDIVLELSATDDEGSITKEYITIKNDGLEEITVVSSENLNLNLEENSNNKNILLTYTVNGMPLNSNIVSFEEINHDSNLPIENINSVYVDMNKVTVDIQALGLNRKTSEGIFYLNKKFKITDDRKRVGYFDLNINYTPLNELPIPVVYVVEENLSDKIYPGDSIIIDSIESYDVDGNIVKHETYVVIDGNDVLLSDNSSIVSFKIPENYNKEQIGFKVVLTDDDLEKTIYYEDINLNKINDFNITITGKDIVNENEISTYSVSIFNNEDIADPRLIKSFKWNVVGLYASALSNNESSIEVQFKEPKESIGEQSIIISYTVTDIRDVESYGEKIVKVKPINEKPIIESIVETIPDNINKLSNGDSFNITVNASDYEGIKAINLTDNSGNSEINRINENNFTVKIKNSTSSKNLELIATAIDTDDISISVSKTIPFEEKPIISINLNDIIINENTSFSLNVQYLNQYGLDSKDEIKEFSWNISEKLNLVNSFIDKVELISTENVLEKDGALNLSVTLNAVTKRDESITKTVNVKVLPVNVKPTVTAELLTTDPYANNDIQVLLNAQDSDGTIEIIYLKNSAGDILGTFAGNDQTFTTKLPTREGKDGYGVEKYTYGTVDNDGSVVEHILEVTYKPLANPVIELTFNPEVNEQTSYSLTANIKDFEGNSIPETDIAEFKWTVNNGADYTLQSESYDGLSIITPTVLEKEVERIVSVTYFVKDNRGLSSEQTVNVKVLPVNVKPVTIFKDITNIDNLYAKDEFIVDLTDSFDSDGVVEKFELNSTLISDIVEVSKGIYKVRLPFAIKEEDKINTSLTAISYDNDGAYSEKTIPLSFEGLEALKIELLYPEFVNEKENFSISAILSNKDGIVENVSSYKWSQTSGKESIEESITINNIELKSPVVLTSDGTQYIEYLYEVVDENGIPSSAKAKIKINSINLAPYAYVSNVRFKDDKNERKDIIVTVDAYDFDESNNSEDRLANVNIEITSHTTERLSFNEFLILEENLNDTVNDISIKVSDDEGLEKTITTRHLIFNNAKISELEEYTNTLEKLPSSAMNSLYVVNNLDIINVDDNGYTVKSLSVNNEEKSMGDININLSNNGDIYSIERYFALQKIEYGFKEINPTLIFSLENKLYFEGDVAVLDVSGTYDLDGTINSIEVKSNIDTTITKEQDKFLISIPERNLNLGEGLFELQVTALDNDGLNTDAIIKVRYKGVNKNPEITLNDSYLFNYGDVIEFLESGKDEDGEIVSYSWSYESGVPLSFLGDKYFTGYTPKAKDQFTNIKLIITDNEGGYSEKTIKLNYEHINNNPIIEEIYGNRNVLAGENQIYRVHGYDNDFQDYLINFDFYSSDLLIEKVSNDSFIIKTSLNDVDKTGIVTVNALDSNGAISKKDIEIKIIKPEQKIIKIDKISLLPVNYATKDALGNQTSRIISETIKDSNGNIITGEQEIFIKINNNAETGFFFGVHHVLPGVETSGVYDFTYNKGKLDMVVFPDQKNINSLIDYNIYLKNINRNLKLLVNENNAFYYNNGFKPSSCFEYKYTNNEAINSAFELKDGFYSISLNGVETNEYCFMEGIGKATSNK